MQNKCPPDTCTAQRQSSRILLQTYRKYILWRVIYTYFKLYVSPNMQFSIINLYRQTNKPSGDRAPRLPGGCGFNICLKEDIHHERLGFHAQLH